MGFISVWFLKRQQCAINRYIFNLPNPECAKRLPWELTKQSFKGEEVGSNTNNTGLNTSQIVNYSSNYLEKAMLCLRTIYWLPKGVIQKDCESRINTVHFARGKRRTLFQSTAGGTLKGNSDYRIKVVEEKYLMAKILFCTLKRNETDAQKLKLESKISFLLQEKVPNTEISISKAAGNFHLKFEQELLPQICQVNNFP